MRSVKPKKFLGQHFLTDNSIAEKIAGALTFHQQYRHVLEVGPGMGVLTRFLMKNNHDFKAIEIDEESISYLMQNLALTSGQVIYGDFLKMKIDSIFEGPYGVIGNFPYNISSQILFKVLENRDYVPEVVGMFQKEVADRICAGHGNKTYGILSVFLQAFYVTEYLFTVDENVFNPPPKVKSAVIRLRRNERSTLECDEKLFYKIVKQAFHTRRKTLRNALKSLNLPQEIVKMPIFDKRAEQLSVEDFISLTNLTNQFLKS